MPFTTSYNQQVGKIIFPSHTESGNRVYSVFNDPKIVSIFQNSEGKYFPIYYVCRKSTSLADFVILLTQCHLYNVHDACVYKMSLNELKL